MDSKELPYTVFAFTLFTGIGYVCMKLSHLLFNVLCPPTNESDLVILVNELEEADVEEVAIVTLDVASQVAITDRGKDIIGSSIPEEASNNRFEASVATPNTGRAAFGNITNQSSTNAPTGTRKKAWASPSETRRSLSSLFGDPADTGVTPKAKDSSHRVSLLDTSESFAHHMSASLDSQTSFPGLDSFKNAPHSTPSAVRQKKSGLLVDISEDCDSTWAPAGPLNHITGAQAPLDPRHYPPSESVDSFA